MRKWSTLSLRLVAVVLSLALTLAALPRAMSAQDASGLQVPNDVQDAAEIGYSNESFGFLVFAVFQYKDDKAAEKGRGELLDLIGSSFDQQIAADAGGSAGATPPAVTKPTEVKDVKALKGLGDDAHAYKVDISEESVTATVYYVLVRDGAKVHLYLTLDFGGDVLSQLQSADPSAAASASAGSSFDTLTQITHDWFTSGFDEKGDLIDQLPGQDQMPDGYTEDSRATNLQEVEATPEALTDAPHAA